MTRAGVAEESELVMDIEVDRDATLDCDVDFLRGLVAAVHRDERRVDAALQRRMQLAGAEAIAARAFAREDRANRERRIGLDRIQHIDRRRPALGKCVAYAPEIR